VSRLAQLRALGFEGSSYNPATRQWQVRCDSCEALVINGIPTHELRCPKQTHECRWCGSTTPPGESYCDESCQMAHSGR
jgi:rRNA maturation endonuclease Nob1